MFAFRRHLPFFALILVITTVTAGLQWQMRQASLQVFEPNNHKSSEAGKQKSSNLTFSQSLNNLDMKLRDSSLSITADIRANLGLATGSREITVLAIDDSTLEAEGSTNGMQWILRQPYSDQLLLLQKHFPPSVLAYDIIFKDVRGDRERRLNPNGIAADPEKIVVISKALEASAESNEISDINLLNLGTYIGEQGELKLASAMGELDSPANPTLKKIPVIAACSFVTAEDLTINQQQGDEFFRWTPADVLGDDPADQREELGNRIPHLTKYAIPNTQVSGITAVFPWRPDASLISRNLSVCQQSPINVPRDADGVVRRVPLIFGTKYFHPAEKKWKEIFVPSFSLSCALSHLGLTSNAVFVDLAAGQLEIREPGGRITRICIDLRGDMVLNFPGRSNCFSVLPFHKVSYYGAWLNKHNESELDTSARENLQTIRQAITGHVCIVGLTHTGNGDTGPTPLEPNASYVFIHATALDNILSGRPAAPLPLPACILILLVVAAFSAWSARVLSVSRMALIHFLLIVLILVVSFACAFGNLPQMPILIPLLQIIVSLIALTVWRYLSEEREKLKVRKMFATMVSQEVLHHMEENPESFSLSGQRTEATMMFSDVAGFTTISEALGPDKLVDLLNQYLTPMTDIIMESGGYLDKYAGDGIMAEWGVPKHDPRHAVAACHACLDQQAKLTAMREDLFAQFGYRLVVRIGVNTGVVSAGNMGSSKHFSYTVMGDAVNLAARLEPTNKDYDTLIIIGQRTWELAKDEIESRFLDRIVVKGKTEAIPIHELIARKGQISAEFRQVVDLYQEGFKLHEERRWDEALHCFRRALEIRPEDGPSKAMIERVEHYIEEPPPEKWQGEYVRKKKD